MAAGLGYIEFATGDILTAAVANGYLASQTVMVFADAAARTSAIASPQEGMISYLKDTNATEYYSGTAWAAVGGGGGGGGKVLQVVYAGTSTSVTSSTSSYIDTGLTATITPSASTSKILVLGTLNGVIKVGTNTSAQIQWLRGATQIARTSDYAAFTGSTAVNDIGSVSVNYLDSPATTSATTYKAQFNSFSNSSYVQVQDNNVLSTLVLMEIGA